MLPWRHLRKHFASIVTSLEHGKGPGYSTSGRPASNPHTGGSKVEQFDMTTIMVRRLTVTGSTMRPRTAAQKGAIARALRSRVWPKLEDGTVQPIVHATFPLAKAAAAHRLMESSEHVGKIMLTV